MGISSLTFDSKGTQYTVTETALKEFTTAWKEYQPHQPIPRRLGRTIRRLIESGWDGRIYPRERCEFVFRAGEKIDTLRKIVSVGWNFFLVKDGSGCEVVAIVRQRN